MWRLRAGEYSRQRNAGVGVCLCWLSARESCKMEAALLVFRCDLVPHLLCQCDQDDSCLVCLLAIYPSLRSTRKHISASHLARGRIEAAQQLSYLFRWQSRSGKLIKLIIQTSKHQEWEQGGTDEFLLHSKLHLPLVLMESVQSADGSREGVGERYCGNGNRSLKRNWSMRGQWGRS